jgi:hypothetical protein
VFNFDFGLFFSKMNVVETCFLMNILSAESRAKSVTFYIILSFVFNCPCTVADKKK